MGKCIFVLLLSLLFAKNLHAQNTAHNYDALGRLTFVQYPDSSSITYTYDPNGNLVTKRYRDPCSSKQRPVINIIGATTFCMGDSALLSVSPGIRFFWSNGDSTHTTIKILASANITVTRLDSFSIPGSDTIQCYLKSDSVIITVNPLPSAISGAPNVCIGLTTVLSDSIAGGSWSSSNTNATIGLTTGIVTGVSTGTAGITYVLPTGCSVATVVSVNPLPSAITGPTIVCAGSNTTLSDGGSGTWNSDNTSIAIVGLTAGVVAGISAGTTIITYTLPTGCTTTTTITVNPLPDAGHITGANSVCVGANITLMDSAAGGSWGISNANATVSSGLITGITQGIDTISYSNTNSCGTAIVTKTITINPLPVAGTITGPSTVSVGFTISLIDTADSGSGTWSAANGNVTVTGGIVSGITAGTSIITYTVINGCGTAVSTNTITIILLPTITGITTLCAGSSATLSNDSTGGIWSSSNTAIAVIGSISGVVTGISAGTTTITYTVSGNSVSIVVTTNPIPATITGTTSVCLGLTTTLNTISTGGTWNSSTTSIASIDSALGIVSGISSGYSIITYSLPTGCINTTTVTVNPLPSAITGTTGVCIGLTTTLSNAGSGTWSSSDTTVATVDAGTGIVLGVTSGTITVTYMLPTGCISTTAITVNPLPASITGMTAVCAGLTITLSDSTAGGVWNSDDTAVASIDSVTGTVTGIAPVTSTITYTLGTGCTTTTTFTVNSLPSIITGISTVCEGLTTIVNDTTLGGTWSSSNVSVANISSGTGTITGISSGTATVTYTLGTGCIAITVATVNPLPSTIAGTGTVCAGLTTTLSDATSGGIWSSGNTTVATADATGIIAGVSAGTVPVTYALSTGCIATATVTVNPLPLSITGTTSVCTGLTTSLSDVNTGGTWSSSNTSIATVGSGIVTGVLAGTVTITYALPTACIITSSLIVNPLPSAIGGSTTICANSTATLSNDITGGFWSSSNTAVVTVDAGSGAIMGVSPGTAVITYTLGTGCINTRSVLVNPLPSAITGITIVSSGYTITLSDPISGGMWTSSDLGIATIGSISGIITGISSGTSIVSYTLPTGCAVTTFVTVNSFTGITTVCSGATTTLSYYITGGSWSSSNASIATVGSMSGIVTGVSGGTVMITYAVGTIRATAIVTVNGAPIITSLSPYTSMPLSSVAIVGTGFDTIATNNIVFFGAMQATVLTASNTTLSVTVPLGATYAPVSVNIFGCALIAYSPFPFLPSFNDTGYVTGIVNFLPKVDFAADSQSYQVAICDIDGDGKPDLAVTNIASNTVSVYRNTSTSGAITSSSFATKVDFATGSQPYGIAMGDVDGDGKPDMVVVNHISNAVSVYRNTATSGSITSGSFATKVDFAAGNNPISIAICDIDMDGKPELVVSNWLDNTISIYRNISTRGSISTGSFAARVNFASGSHPRGIATDDIDMDGKPDILIANNGSNNISIYRNTSTIGAITSGSIAARVNFTTGIQPIHVAIGDLDGDGKPDVTVANNGSNTISVFRNNATSGTITGTSLMSKVDFATGGTPYNSSIGDFDGDGKPDLAVANSSSNTVSVFRNTATSGSITSGSFAAKADFGTAASPRYVAVDDLDGDTKSDLVTSNLSANSISVLRNAPIALITGITHACVGGTTALSDATPGGTWSSSNTAVATVGAATGIVTGILSGTTLITYALPGGRAATTVTVNPLPGAGTISGSASVVVGSTITLTDGVSGGIWSSMNTTIATIGSSTGIVIGVVAGTTVITYAVTNSFSCSSMATKTVTVTSGSGGRHSGSLEDSAKTITNISAGSNIKVFPNPNKGEFTIQGSLGTTDDQEVIITITDVPGQIVCKNKLIVKNGEIHESLTLNNTLANGSYTLILQFGSENIPFQIVLNR
jgi:trimeric autotransporter adhesin